MSTYHRFIGSDWAVPVAAIFLASGINSVFGFEYALIQAIATSLILYVDKEYMKVLAFIAVYNIAVFFAPDSIYAVIFAAFTFGWVLHRVPKWRHYHRINKAKEFME